MTEPIVKLKQSRAGHLSDLTKKKRACDDTFVDGSSITTIKLCLNAYEKSFANFVASHEKYLSVENDSHEIDKANGVYEDHRDHILRLQIEFSRLETNHAETHIAARSKVSLTRKSGSSSAEIELREAEISMQALKEKHKLDMAEAEIRMRREMLELETKKKLAEEKIMLDGSTRRTGSSGSKGRIGMQVD